MEMLCKQTTQYLIKTGFTYIHTMIVRATNIRVEL